MDDHELLDVGGGARLDRFGERVVDRPFPAAVGSRQAPDAWARADLRYDRDGGWSGRCGTADLEPWIVHLAGLTLELRPTEAGQVGLFPEHALRLPWLATGSRPASGAASTADTEPPRVLHLFAYTGLATWPSPAPGPRSRTSTRRGHRHLGTRERRAQRAADRPVRWLVDDARGFATREVRRDRRYDGIVLDPPSYGHGEARSATWRLEDDLRPSSGPAGRCCATTASCC